jgi:hypothetical protein
MPKRHNATGRSLNKERFAMLPRSAQYTEAYRRLSFSARSFLLEIAALYMGENNGFLGLSARQAAERMNCTKDTANKASRELLDVGFLEVAYRGSYESKLENRSNEYRLTWRRCDKTNALPSRAYLNWQPTPKKNDDPKNYDSRPQFL